MPFAAMMRLYLVHRSNFWPLHLTRQLILSLEGFATDALSCYGSSWNRTPGFDSLAADGLLYDRVVVHDVDPLNVLRALVPSLNESDVFATDDERWVPTGDSAQVLLEASDVPASAATTIEETHFARLVDRISQLASDVSGTGTAWLHSRFLAQRWDAPRDLFPIDDEIDEEVFEDELSGESPTPIVDRHEAIFGTVRPPRHRCDEADSIDLVMAWMRTYGCQVRLVDRLLDSLVEAAEDTESTLIVLGTSGFSLGQNGWIGHGIGPVRSCRLSVPLIIRPPIGSFQSGPIRWRDPISTQRIPDIMATASSVTRPLVAPADWAGEHPDQFAPLIPTRTEEATTCVTTSKWFFARDLDDSTHLHLKPDDRQDHNNVSRLRPDVIEDLETALAKT